MTPREWLIQLCILKNEYVYNKSRGKLEYCSNDDLRDIESWSDIDCSIVCNKIRDYILNWEEGIYCVAGSICPWCVRPGLVQNDVIDYLKNGDEHIHYSCAPCGYQERHGNCNNDGSNFEKIKSLFTNRNINRMFMTEKIRDFARDTEIEKA